MPRVWFSLKRSLHCKSELSDVHNPKSRKHLTTISTKRAGRSGCSRSIANLKDVIHGGNKRHIEKPPSCSPRSIGSSEFLNPITHEVILSNSRCELKISGNGAAGAGVGSGGGSTFVGTLRPGTPGPGGYPTMHYFSPSFRTSSTPPRKFPFLISDKEGGFGHSTSNRLCLEADSYGSSSSTLSCHKCGEQFSKWEAAEAHHHLSKHAGWLLEILVILFWPHSFWPFLYVTDMNCLCYGEASFGMTWFFSSWDNHNLISHLFNTNWFWIPFLYSTATLPLKSRGQQYLSWYLNGGLKGKCFATLCLFFFN